MTHRYSQKFQFIASARLCTKHCFAHMCLVYGHMSEPRAPVPVWLWLVSSWPSTSVTTRVRMCSSSLKTYFWTSGSAWTENVESAPTQNFQFKHFPRSKIDSESRFLKKHYIVTVLIFFFGAFWSVFEKVKKWISYCIFQFSIAEGRFIVKR